MVTLRKPTSAEVKAILDLLETNGLPIVDYDLHRIHALVAVDDGDLVGHGGLELHGDAALLRSVAVLEARRGEGIAETIVNALIADLPGEVRNVFLLTESAEEYFMRRGFAVVDRKDVPPLIATTSEFSELCPGSATLMVKSL